MKTITARVAEIAASVEGATPAACDVLARRMATKGGVGDPEAYLRRIVRFQETGEYQRQPVA